MLELELATDLAGGYLSTSWRDGAEGSTRAGRFTGMTPRRHEADRGDHDAMITGGTLGARPPPPPPLCLTKIEQGHSAVNRRWAAQGAIFRSDGGWVATRRRIGRLPIVGLRPRAERHVGQPRW